jgi:hypothetical protein
VKILKDSAYHSEEWEETDSSEAVEEVDDNEEAVQTKSNLIVIYERWWRSPAVRIFIIY